MAEAADVALGIASLGCAAMSPMVLVGNTGEEIPSLEQFFARYLTDPGPPTL